MRSLDLDIAFPEQLPVGSVLVVDLVEGYLVVDVPDVLESLGQFNIAIGEVEIQFRELADCFNEYKLVILSPTPATSLAAVTFPSAEKYRNKLYPPYF